MLQECEVAVAGVYSGAICEQFKMHVATWSGRGLTFVLMFSPFEVLAQTR